MKNNSRTTTAFAIFTFPLKRGSILYVFVFFMDKKQLLLLCFENKNHLLSWPKLKKW